MVSPSWTTYAPQCRLAGHEPTVVETSFESEWKVKPEALEKALKVPQGNKMLVLNNPGNPCAHSSFSFRTTAHTQLQRVTLTIITNTGQIKGFNPQSSQCTEKPGSSIRSRHLLHQRGIGRDRGHLSKEQRRRALRRDLLAPQLHRRPRQHGGGVPRAHYRHHGILQMQQVRKALCPKMSELRAANYQNTSGSCTLRRSERYRRKSLVTVPAAGEWDTPSCRSRWKRSRRR